MKKIVLTLMFCCLLIGITSAQTAPKPIQDTEINTYYYESSKIQFAEGIDMEKLEVIKPNTVFYLKDGNVTVTTIVSMEKPFKTNKIEVDVYDDDGEMEQSFTVDINEEWLFFSFTIEFQTIGTHSVELYSRDDHLINSADIYIE